VHSLHSLRPAKVLQFPWLIIFIHGTVAAPFSPFSSLKLAKDELDGTLYQKALMEVRDSELLYKNCLMLPKKGLCEIDLKKINTDENKNYAAFRFIKFYKEVFECVNQNTEQHFYYTYEWSGALSQKERRLESIKFNNALVDLLSQYGKKRIYPKIRIFAHSHGGNVSLNLGAVRNYIRNKLNLDSVKKKSNIDEVNSTQEISNLIDSLPDKALASEIQKKNCEYRPMFDVVVDELILFGTPIQPETECFCVSGAFEKVYNFYSPNDMVQCIDVLSTRKNPWRRTFGDNYVKQAKNKIIQKKIFTRPGHIEMWKIKNDEIPAGILAPIFMHDQDSKKLFDKFKDTLGHIKNELITWHSNITKT